MQSASFLLLLVSAHTGAARRHEEQSIRAFAKAECAFDKPNIKLIQDREFGAVRIDTVVHAAATTGAAMPSFFNLDPRWVLVQNDRSNYFYGRNAQCLENIINCTNDNSWKEFLESILGAKAMTGSRSIIEHKNAILQSNGFYGLRDSCHIATNSGCEHKKVSKELRLNITRDFRFPIRKEHDRVIMLSHKFGRGVYHFPMESLMGLSLFSSQVIAQSDIHVTARSPYILQWLELVGIAPERVVEGNIGAKSLYLPTFSCSHPSVYGLKWLRSTVFSHLNISELRKSERQSTKHIVIIERTRSRGLVGIETVKEVAVSMARLHGYVVEVYSDSNLPPLADQVKLFSNANIIIGPHGAGMLFMAFARSNACLVEYARPNTGGLCFPSQAYALGINYANLIDFGKGVNKTELTATITKCINSQKASL